MSWVVYVSPDCEFAWSGLWDRNNQWGVNWSWFLLSSSGHGIRWMEDGRRAGWLRRGDISSISIVTVTVGGARVDGLSSTDVTWGEGGWDVGSCKGFVMSLSGDLTLDEDRSILLECLGGMNKGGGEFSLSDKSGVPVELIVVGIDLNWVYNVVNNGVSEGEGGWLLVVVAERGGHAQSSFRWRVLILLDWFWNSASNSNAWRSLVGTYSSCDGE